MSPSAPSVPRIAFVTLGCPKNEVDSDRMRAAVLDSGLTVSEDIDDADVVIVNTCSFIQAATEESIETVLELVGDQSTGRGKRDIVVAGCLPSRYGSELAEALPEITTFVPVAEEGRLVSVLAELTETPLSEDRGAPGRTATGAAAYLQVSDGCHRACAFCTIPSIRGPYRSRPLGPLFEEATSLVKAGARELTLIGQDISAWGRDLEGAEDLPHLVRTLATVDGLDWLRLMYVQPDGVTDELIHVMREAPAVCHYLDMPLQHASERVLRRMRRSGSAEEFLALISRLREAMPDIALRTTVIAGYPGESREDVRELQRFLRVARFDYVGVFAYSPEDGTPASALPDQVPLRTRRARAQRVRDLADETAAARAYEHIGQELDVLVEGYDEEEGRAFGRWRGQAPDVDGVVLLDGGRTGEIVRARITDAFGYDLEGELTA